MMLKPNQRCAGMTLHESIVSVAIFVSICGALFTLMAEADSVFGTSISTSRARAQTSSTLRFLRREIEQASAATLTIDNTPANHDELRLQVPLQFTAGAVVWGAWREIGGVRQDFPGHTLVYFLEPQPGNVQRMQLVRRILDPGGLVIGQDEILQAGVDDLDPLAGKGFGVTRNNNIVSVQLRLRQPTSRAGGGQFDVIRQSTATVRLRSVQ